MLAALVPLLTLATSDDEVRSMFGGAYVVDRTSLLLKALFLVKYVETFQATPRNLTVLVYDRFGSISSVVFGLPLIRYLPRRWPWFRDRFQLEEKRDD